MRLGNRWSILGLVFLGLMALWALSSTSGSFVLAEGSPAEPDSNRAETEIGDEAPLFDEAPLLLEEPEPILLSHEGCHAKVFCSDGTTRECEGSEGESCTTGTESCQGSTCTSTRKFVLCGTQKLTCPCDCPSCPDPGCPAGAQCRSHTQCGPCGACLGGRCVCIS